MLLREKSRVARQRRVYEILESELKERVHALSLVTLTPDEDDQKRQRTRKD